jgi:hypothetical protein
MRVSCGSTTPALSASAMSERNSSSVTRCSGSLCRPKEAQDQPGGSLEQPHRRGGKAGQRRHRRGHERGHPLGIGERDLLRHELADDEREVGDGRDYRGHRDRLCGSGSKPERLEIAGEVLSQGGASKGASEHANERDPDLHAREEASLVLKQTQSGSSAGTACLGHNNEARPARGDDGELGHGEEAVEDNQEGNNAELKGEHSEQSGARGARAGLTGSWSVPEPASPRPRTSRGAKRAEAR